MPGKEIVGRPARKQLAQYRSIAIRVNFLDRRFVIHMYLSAQLKKGARGARGAPTCWCNN